MKLTKREKKMLIILLIVAISALYYNFLLSPQLNKINALEKSLEEYKQKVSLLDNKIMENKNINREYKVLNARISSMYIRFLPEIIQEKIIVILDNMLVSSDLESENISFSEPEIKSLEEKDEKEEEYQIENLVKEFLGYKNNNKNEENSIENGNIPRVKVMNVEIDFRGTYEELINFIRLVENYEKEILINRLNVVNQDSDNLIGFMELQFYSIPKIHNQDKEFITWNIVNDYGKNNPFMNNNSLSNKLFNEYKEDKIEYDFLMSVKPTSSDLPTIILGKNDDPSKKTYVYGDNPNIETIDIYFTQKNDKYYFKYKTKYYSYPMDFNKSEEFTPKNNNISLKIYSTHRNSSEDVSGAIINLYNNTDKNVFVKIVNDDIKRPRVFINKKSGIIEVSKE
ncbi:hypothetical protein [Thermohalobacter berrensis]|uniref:Type IV pilus assembly protein PilO n=1 Tax=Thermohalobacter berrensis TaxID=99594 RepID=A0A419TAS9_9FIRM|nr:hypothetical protein [Thermohalobacter berrensis]RKD34588.1 hypothetical protein BET03_01815 [Thermohalobacter berrensis]